MFFYTISKFRKFMSQRYSIIRSKIIEKLSPEVLEIRDDSALHKNHGNVKIQLYAQQQQFADPAFLEALAQQQQQV